MAGMSKVLTVNMTVKELNNKLNMKVNCNDETINMKMSNPFYNTGGSLYGTNVIVSTTQPVGQRAGDIWLVTRDE